MLTCRNFITKHQGPHKGIFQITSEFLNILSAQDKPVSKQHTVSKLVPGKVHANDF